VKKYRNPNIPRPTPGDSKSEATRYKTQPVKPEPTPKPKPKPKKAGNVKRRDVSDEQLVPRRVKPTPSRRRFLEELNEMNKRSR
jgi:hypothetical protein